MIRLVQTQKALILTEFADSEYKTDVTIDMSCLLFANVRYIRVCSPIPCGRHIVVSNVDVIHNMCRVSVGDIRICYIRVVQPVPLSFVLSVYYT